MNCPKCNGTLKHLSVMVTPRYGGDVLNNERAGESITVEECVSCNGTWFAANMLNEYLSEKLVVINAPAVPQSSQYNRKIGNCPQCATLMKEDLMQNVVIDRCPSCQGVWLDGGELNALSKKTLNRTEKHQLFFETLIKHFKEEGT